MNFCVNTKTLELHASERQIFHTLSLEQGFNNLCCDKIRLSRWSSLDKKKSVTIVTMDQCQYLSNYAPTPPLTLQQSTDNKLGLMLGQGTGRSTVVQRQALIQCNWKCSSFISYDDHATEIMSP